MSADASLSDARSYALALANRGFDPPMIARALLRSDELLAIQSRSGSGRALRTAEGIAGWAVAYAARYPREEWRSRIPARIVRYREVADSIPWTGRTGPTDRRVLEAFYLSGTFARSTKFRLAARTIGTRTGTAWRTANEAKNRLLTRGVIRIAGSYGPGLGTKYVLAAPCSWDTAFLHDRSLPPAPIVPGCGIRSPDDPLNQQLLRHPAFQSRADALGDAGWMVAYWLDPLEPATARALSAATGIGYDRVRRALGGLHRIGAARPVPGGWVRLADDDLIAALDAAIGERPPRLLLVQERGTTYRAIALDVVPPSWWEVWWWSLSADLRRAA